MTRTIAMVISAAFLLGTTGLAGAQTSTTTPAPSTTAPAPAPPKAMTVEEKAKKASAANEQALANCKAKAGTDEAKKAECQKRHDARQHKIAEKQQQIKK